MSTKCEVTSLSGAPVESALRQRLAEVQDFYDVATRRIASLEAENERLRTASIALLKWFSEELPAWQPETVVRYLIKGNMEPVVKLRAALKGRG